MAENILPGQNLVHAKQTRSLDLFGFDPNNVLVIYSFEPNLSPSWKPGRQINRLTQVDQGKSYLIKALESMDLNEYFDTLYTTGSGTGNPGIVTEDGLQIMPE